MSTSTLRYALVGLEYGLLLLINHWFQVAAARENVHDREDVGLWLPVQFGRFGDAIEQIKLPLLVLPRSLELAHYTPWRFLRGEDLGGCLAFHEFVYLLLCVCMPHFACQLVKLVGRGGVFFIVNCLEHRFHLLFFIDWSALQVVQRLPNPFGTVA